jgi:3-hydroxybutyryl-CoA dehydrogenase
MSLLRIGNKSCAVGHVKRRRDNMSFQNIVVAGGGVLGTQIGFQAAYKGKNVTFWLRSEGSIGRTQPKIDRLRDIYLKTLDAQKALCGTDTKRYARGLVDGVKNLTPEKIEELKQQVEKAYKNIKIELDMAKAVADADLVIESMTEDPKAKIDVYTKMKDLLPEKTVIVTNSSTMVPSQFRDYTGRPDRYMALHFANEIWNNNTAEVMGHDGTDPKVYEEVAQFAKEIGMIPLRLQKEQPGYILNTMLVPFLTAAESLYANGVSDPATIDLTWQLATGAPVGPFRILDIVGLKTAYDICVMNPQSKDPGSTMGRIVAMLKKYLDEGKTGVNAGEGFYKY